MASRLKLQEELETLLGTKSVYFQPPENFRMSYPCIRYTLSKIPTLKADNLNYAMFKCYEVMYITRNPDDPIIDSILERFPKSQFVRQYRSDNLYHNVYSIYY